MKLIDLLVHQKRLILTTAILLALAGLFAWFNMNRQEDPFFPYRNGFVLTQYPGASVEDIENLVLDPLEQELAQVEEVNQIQGLARAGFAQITVRMHEHIYDTDTAWNHVRDAIKRAQNKFPQGVFEPQINDRVIDTPLVVYAITGNSNILVLRKAAEDIKKDLLKVSEISKIKLYGQAIEEISIEPKNEVLYALGINPSYLAKQVNAKTKVVALQSLQADSRQFILNAQTAFQSIAEIKQSLISLPDGSSLPLNVLAEVKYSSKQDVSSSFWLDGKRAVGIGMFVPVNRLNVVKFGKKLKKIMANIAKDYPSVTIKPVFFQPDRVSKRISELGNSLLMGMLLVTLVLTFFLGLRAGLVLLPLPLWLSMIFLAMFYTKWQFQAWLLL